MRQAKRQPKTKEEAALIKVLKQECGNTYKTFELLAFIRSCGGVEAVLLKNPKLKRFWNKQVDQESTKVFVGERGGRYYKRTRPDGTTYREYTF